MQALRRRAASALLHASPASLFPPAASLLSSARVLSGVAASAPHEPPLQPGAPVLPVPPPYVFHGRRVTGPYPSPPPTGVFAVVQGGAHQFKVAVNDLIYVERIAGLDINDRVSLPRVLMLGTAARTVVGRPYVPAVSVECVCEEQVRDAKVIIFKKRRRKSSRTNTGHRQKLTSLRVIAIDSAGVLAA